MKKISIIFLSILSLALGQSATCVAADPPREAAPEADRAPTEGKSPTAPNTDAPAEPCKDTKEPPNLTIACVHVHDREVLGGTAKNASPVSSERGSSPPECSQGRGGTLIGTGDVVVSVTAPSYQDMTRYELCRTKRASLFINGVNLGDDAPLVSTERHPSQVDLRYNVRPGDHSRALWAALYRASSDMDGAHPLSASLGYDGKPVTVSPGASTNYVAVTDKTSFWLAVSIIAALAGLALFVATNTDALRDTKTPGWYSDALKRRRLYRNEKIPAKKTALLTAIDATYVNSADDTYIQAAQQALATAPNDDAGIKRAMLGIVLRTEDWKGRRATYSLARVQLFLWFFFAVVAGVFLWVVYGRLPKIDGSLLALLGITVGVTGMSLAIDERIPKPSFTPSQGFLRDLTTDFEDKQQAHRYQALVVTLLLLGVGAVHVLQHLEYPIFDPTWLIFLGISGVALTGGKQLNEAKA